MNSVVWSYDWAMKSCTFLDYAPVFVLQHHCSRPPTANNFFNILSTTRNWATGGSNSGEMWGAPHRLGDGLNADTEESCTTYNVLKVRRILRATHINSPPPSCLTTHYYISVFHIISLPSMGQLS